MKHLKVIAWLCLGLSSQAFLFSIAQAQTTQTMVGKINPDLSVTLDWSLPLDTDSYSDLNLTLPTNLGFMGIDYTLQSAYDAFGPIEPTAKGNATYNLRFNHLMAGVQGIHTVTHVLPAFVSPFFIGYDFTPMTDEFLFKSPTLDLTYPTSLRLIGSEPAYASASNPVHIAYPNNPNAGLIEVNFLKSPLPAGYVSVDQGIYTIVGSAVNVERVRKLVKGLDALPDAFRKILGTFGLDHVYIIVASFSGKGNFGTELGALKRSNDLIIFDTGNFVNGGDDVTLRETVVHELTHSVVSLNAYRTEEKFAPWFDEGMSVFMQHQVGREYLNDTDYYVAPGEDGKLEVFQNLFQHFSLKAVRARYEKPFVFEEPTSGDAAINDFYTHAGLVFEHFYAVAGGQGMHALLDKMGRLGTCSTDEAPLCDTDRILAVMSGISGLSKDQLLFPYKGDANFNAEIKQYIREPLTQAEIDAILSKYPPDQVAQSKIFGLKPNRDVTEAPVPIQRQQSEPVKWSSLSWYAKVGVVVMSVTTVDLACLLVALLIKLIIWGVRKLKDPHHDLHAVDGE